MAEAQRMTAADVVAQVRDGRLEDFVREAVVLRYRWGYRTLVAEVSDSIQSRRFCRIALSERVSDESCAAR